MNDAPPDLVFHPASHTYVWAGAIVPSVTQVLACWSTIAQLPAHILEPAAERGVMVHEATTLYDEGDLNAEWAEAAGIAGYVLAWHRFRTAFRFEPRYTEKLVLCPKLRYAGTFDNYGEAHSGSAWYPLLLDKKSGDSDPTHPLQLAAYANAAGELHSCRRATVYLHDDGKFDYEEHRSPEHWIDFLACLRHYRWKERYGVG